MKPPILIHLALGLTLLVSGPVSLGQTTWTQSDWSGNQYVSIESTDPDASPGELILTNDPSSMVLAMEPCNLEGVWDMEVYDGKLFMAVCSEPVAVSGGLIFSYDYATNETDWEYSVWEQGVIQMRTHNGKLYIPGVDSQGSWDWGNIYVYDGSSWLRKSTVPHGLHVFDLIFYKEAMYVTTGTDLDNSSGKVFISTDDGDSFMEVFSVSALGSDFRRFYMMGIYRDTLYVQGDTKAPEGKVLFRFDGTSWTSIAFDSLLLSVGKLKAYQDKFYFLNGHFIHIYDGQAWNTVNLPFSGMVNSTATGKRITRGLGFYKDFLYGGGEHGLLYRSGDGYAWEQCSPLGNPSEEIESIQVYHGRLYVGVNDTASTGKVYVSASAPEGNLVSEKHEFAVPVDGGTISWTALTPGQTLVRFQLRTADSEAGLENEDFTGPDGSTLGYYETPGEELGMVHQGKTWIQYKVLMASNDSALSPVLQDVAVSALPVSVPEHEGVLLQVEIYPNPCSGVARLRYLIHDICYLISDLYLISGKKILELVHQNVSPGEYETKIDVSDLQAGVYLLRVQAGKDVVVKKLVVGGW